MKLTKKERETVILYSEADSTASVYTYDRRLISKLKRLNEKYPDMIYPNLDENNGAVSYIIPKRCVCIFPPYTEERRKADSERAIRTGLMPPKIPKTRENE